VLWLKDHVTDLCLLFLLTWTIIVVIQDIVRERTWDTVKSRSTDGRGGQTWRQAFEKWLKDHES